MFKNLNVRTILIAVAAVIGLLLVLGMLSSVVSALLPLGIALLIGFVVGRSSAGMSLNEMVAKIPIPQRQQTVPADEAQAQTEAPRQKTAPVAPRREQPEAAAPDPQADQAAERLTDFVIKDAETLSAEARALEERIAARNRDYDPAAALEERRRRLLGDQSNE
jgi:hypothetical protein